ncbi:MAG: carbon-nitrogen hydrolase family protein [Firmicutes bacterium]|nr:carbon-nitrogen hydrolase family protein [Bacillota bacterium]
MKTALIQMQVTTSKDENLQKAARLVEEAAENGARIAALPEMFCCPYDNSCFPLYAEPKGGLMYTTLARAAKDAGITLVAGSIPEREGEKLYNTSFVFDKNGNEIARHRKAHLFDIDVEGGQHFHESEVFTPGDQVTVFTAEGHTFGLAICFDIRFAELFRCMSLAGAEAVFVPAAFNMTTGPLHWELSFRMRAVDNQYFTLGCAPARDESASYVSYANSLICSPWGKVLERAGSEETILYGDLDLEENKRVRAQLPILSAMRPELYGKKLDK